MLVSVASFAPILIVGAIADWIGTTAVFLLVAPGRRLRHGSILIRGHLAPARWRYGPTSMARPDRDRAGREMPEGAFDMDDDDEDGADGGPSFRAARPSRPQVRSRPTARSSARGPRRARRSRPAIRPRPTATPRSLARGLTVARVAVVFTGGTISMRHDPVAGGNVPALSGAEILAQVPGLDEVADVVDRPRPDAGEPFHVPGPVRAVVGDPDVARGSVGRRRRARPGHRHDRGDRVLPRPAPRRRVAARRDRRDARGERRDYDGPANLRRAVAAAAAPELRGAGTVVVLSGSIEPADDVTKTHTLAFDTFRSLNSGSLGRVDGDRVVVERARGPRRHVTATSAEARPSRDGDRGDGRDADRCAAGGGSGRLRRRGHRRGQPAASLLAAAERRWPTGCRSR
jgi:L-asparaginase